MYGKLATLLIECENLALAKDFYAGTLELPVVDEGEGWVRFDSGVDLVLWQGRKNEVVPGFAGAELESALESLRAKGCEPTTIEDHPGGRHFYVTDPGGNTLMVGGS